MFIYIYFLYISSATGSVKFVLIFQWALGNVFHDMLIINKQNINIFYSYALRIHLVI